MRVARSLLRSAQRFLPAATAEPRLTILAYHLVGAGTGSPVDLPMETFERQLDEISALGDPVALETGLARLRDGKNGGRPMIALTFDDAYENFGRSVLPRLAAAGIPATLFVPVGFVQRESPAPLTGAESLPPLSWHQLREMVETGLVAVGSHTWTHGDLRASLGDEASLERELHDSRQVLEDRCAARVRSFCYPRGLWSPGCEGEVQRHYDHAVVGGGRKITASNLRALRLWRVPVRRDMPPSLAPLVASRVYLEEWLADKARRWLPAGAAR